MFKPEAMRRAAILSPCPSTVSTIWCPSTRLLHMNTVFCPSHGLLHMTMVCCTSHGLLHISMVCCPFHGLLHMSCINSAANLRNIVTKVLCLLYVRKSPASSAWASMAVQSYITYTSKNKRKLKNSTFRMSFSSYTNLDLFPSFVCR